MIRSSIPRDIQTTISIKGSFFLTRIAAKELRSHGDMANPTPGVDSDVLSENGGRQLLRDD